MLSGILNASAVMLATYRSLIMSSPRREITLTINHAIRKATIQNVTSASISFQQTLLVLLNIGHIHSGSKNIALLMNTITLQDVAAVSEWSHERLDISVLMMAGSFA